MAQVNFICDLNIQIIRNIYLTTYPDFIKIFLLLKHSNFLI